MYGIKIVTVFIHVFIIYESLYRKKKKKFDESLMYCPN